MDAPTDRRTAGFTLLEILAVLAIVAVLAAVVLPSAIAVNEDAQQRAEVRRLMAELRRARSSAVSQREVSPGVAVGSTGITVISATEYWRFLDNDLAAGGETAQSIVDISETGLTIQFPAIGGQIRFRRNGTRLDSSADRIELRGSTGKTFEVAVPLSGLIQLN